MADPLTDGMKPGEWSAPKKSLVVFDNEQAERIAEIEADANQCRAALTQIRDEAAMMQNGGSWAAGIAALSLGTLKIKS